MANFGFNTTGDDVVNRYQDNIHGRTILITGASAGGMGAETALSLARGKPKQLILLARTLQKVQSVIDNIKDIDDDIETHFIPVELDSTASIRSAVDNIRARSSIKKIDIVINSAGTMGGAYRENDAGIETQLATNHIGHFYLTKHLQPWLKAAGKGARIINIASGGYMISNFRFDDYNFSDGRGYNSWTAYGQSKTANILFTRQLARKLVSAGVQSFAVHPGVVVTTPLSSSIEMSAFAGVPGLAKRTTGADMKPEQPKTVQQGVATGLVAALDPSLEDKTGSYLTDCAVEPLLNYASSEENAKRLWKLSETLIGEEWNLDTW